MSFSSFPNAELRQQHFCKGQLWIVTRELWLTIKKQYHNCHISKEVCDTERTRDLTPEGQSLLPGTCFPRSSSPVQSLVPNSRCIHFCTLQCKGLIPVSQMMKLKHRKLCISTLSYWLMGLQLHLHLDSSDWPPSNSTIACPLCS